MPSIGEGQRNSYGQVQSTTKNKWRCNICGKIFESQYILNYHKLLEHSKSKRPPIGVA